MTSRLNDQTNLKPTPPTRGQVLQPDIDGESMNDNFSYLSIIGKANFLEKSSRPDIAIAIKQCARFLSDLKWSYAQVVRYFGKYLYGTKDEGIYLDPKSGKSFNFLG
jgi:hypothetical protein